eukprot:gene10718-22381_t
MNGALTRRGQPVNCLTFFLERAESYLQCPICLEYLHDPYQCEDGHNFCKNCIIEALSCKSFCPVCRCALSIDLLHPNRVMKDILHDLVVYCNNTNFNHDYCSWSGPLVALECHRQQECPYQLIQCSNNGCLMWIHRQNMTSHILTCIHRLLPCEHCHKFFTNRDLPSHINSCIHRLIQCPNIGCNVILTLADMEEKHRNKCDWEVVDCPLLLHDNNCIDGCPGTMCRKDLLNHMSNTNVTASAIINLLQKQVLLLKKSEHMEYRMSLLTMSSHISLHPDTYRSDPPLTLQRWINDLLNFVPSYNNDGDGDGDGDGVNSSTLTLLRQLQTKNPFESQSQIMSESGCWEVHHFAWEASTVSISDVDGSTTPIRSISSPVFVCTPSNISVKLAVASSMVGSLVVYYAWITGLHIPAIITLTLFRLEGKGKGLPPRQKVFKTNGTAQTRTRTTSSTSTTSCDVGMGFADCMHLFDIYNDGYISSENSTLKILVTMCLDGNKT